MRTEFALPDLGEGIAEGELIAWHVEPDDHVEEDQVIAEVETDKALVDLPSPYEGRILQLRAEEGEIVPVDTVLVEFEVDDERDATVESDPNETEDTTGRSGASTFARPRVRRLARELDVDLDQIEPAEARITADEVRDAAAEPTASQETEKSASEPPDPPTTNHASGGSSADRDRSLAVPATRRLAREEGVNIDQVPTGERRDGEAFVTAADVRAFAEGAEASQIDAESREPEGDRPEPGDRVPYTGIRRTVGERMATSKYTAPHVSHHDEVEVSSLVAMRERLADEAAERGVTLTYLPFAVKAAAAALEEVPAINAELDEENDEIVLYDTYNIGIAVATEAGLMVPVIETADRKSILEIARDINDKAERARDRSLGVAELQGSTFTITNIGAIGGEYASPIINYPEAAILSLGALEERPWVEDGEVVARPTMPISLTSDHRIVDGLEAGTFTNVLKRYLHDPTLLLLE